MTLRAGAGLSTEPVTSVAARSAVEAAVDMMGAAGGGSGVSLAVVITSPHHDDSQGVLDIVCHVARPYKLIGGVAESVVGGAREIEDAPAISVWLLSVDAPAAIDAFHSDFVRTGDGGAFTGHEFAPGPHVLIADPYTFPVDVLARQLNAPESEKTLIVGGMAGGARRPGQTRLFFGDDVLDSGAVGARFSGLGFTPLVSQGCRPIGRPMTVTKAVGQAIHELAGRPPRERLHELVASATPAEQDLLSRGLHIGRVIDEHKDEFVRGDFLIRGVLGFERETEALVVGDTIEVGETVRFHVRDAASAHDDLSEMLDTAAADAASSGATPAAALLFTCNGRGSHLFGQPDHDARMISARFGGLPLAGFFAAGEIGPVGGRTFLHGFTASVALLSG